ncbi:MAG: tetratricopeptide repeat protein [Nitrospirota bacterium]
MIKNILYKPVVHILIIIVICIVSYSNTFHVPFVFDGLEGIVENPVIKDLHYFIEPSKGADFKDYFEYTTFKRRYVGYLTFALNYKLHGLDVAGYHMFNLVIHIINSLLVYVLVILTFRSHFLKESKTGQYSMHIAVFAALFFAAHPIQTQAVTYIWQRVTSLSATFYIFSLLMYIKARFTYEETPSSEQSLGKALKIKTVLYYMVSIISAVLAMKTKEIAFTLPVVIALYEIMFLNGSLRKRILFLIPFLITMLIIPLSLIDLDRPVGELLGGISKASKETGGVARLDYLFTEFRVIVTYIRLIFIPVNQHIDYVYPIYSSLFDPEVLLSVLFLGLIFSLGIYLFYKYRNIAPHSRLISFGIFWFFITLSVESSIIPIKDVIFEHRIYLPSAGVFVVFSTCAFTVWEKLKDRLPNMDTYVITALILIVIMLTGATYARNIIWKDSLSLWMDTVRKSPKNARAYSSVCYAYRERKLFNEALEYCNTSIQLNPLYVRPYINRGIIYHTQGHVDKAIEQFQRAIEVKPDFPEAYYDLGIVYHYQGLYNDAIQQYRKAITLNPGYAEAYNNMGSAYKAKGNIDEAITLYQTAIKYNPESPGAHNNLGSALKAKGLIDKAISEFRIALQLAPGHAQARNNLGAATMMKNYLQKQKKEQQ